MASWPRGYSQKKKWVGVCGPLPKGLALFMTKTAEKLPPLGATHTYIAHTREYSLPDLMINAFVSGSSSPGSSPGRGHCVVFSGKILHCRSASLLPGV